MSSFKGSHGGSFAIGFGQGKKHGHFISSMHRLNQLEKQSVNSSQKDNYVDHIYQIEDMHQRVKPRAYSNIDDNQEEQKLISGGSK